MSVTTIPSASATMIVRGSTTIEALGRSTPNASKRRFSPLASATPSTSPTSEAKTPMTSPSVRTERLTWRLDAPSVRRVASSRMRWASVIESVLKITNAPTPSAMKPNPSRKYWTNLLCSWVSFALASACCCPVLTCAAAGTIGRSSRTSCSGETPSRAATRMVSYCPRLPSRAWAVGTSKTAIVEPPMESTVP